MKSAWSRLRFPCLIVLAAAGAGACSQSHLDLAGPPKTAAERASDATLYTNTHGGGTTCTFDRTKVLVAYCKSARFTDSMRALTEQYKQAQERGDSSAQAACRREGESRQELLHQQLAGRAPLSDIAGTYRNEIDSIGREHNASIIIAADAVGTQNGAVDVTNELVNSMPPAPKAPPK